MPHFFIENNNFGPNSKEDKSNWNYVGMIYTENVINHTTFEAILLFKRMNDDKSMPLR